MIQSALSTTSANGNGAGVRTNGARPDAGAERRGGGGEVGLHVAIIMDGNGRWAEARGLPRSEGHRVGSRVVRDVVRSAPELGIDTLTLYAFSSDNWSRPRSEVDAVLGLLRDYLCEETATCVEKGVRLEVLGRRDRLPGSLLEAIEGAERRTATGRVLRLRLAIDYSARDEILNAACEAVAQAERHGVAGACDELTGWLTRDRFRALMGGTDAAPDVDLLIRTGGEKRLSDFMLWECAYAELVFLDGKWPDFGPADLEAAVTEYRSRERRFGRVRVAG